MRSPASTRRASRRWLQYVSALLMFNAAGFVLLYAILRLQGYLPLNPQGFGGMSEHLAFNTAASLRHQHQLAELRRRDDAVLLQPDGRPHRAELRLGGDRHGGRRAAGACLRPRQVDDGRQLLGRPDARHALRAAAAVDRRGVRAHRARRAAEPQPIRRCDDARRRQADDRAGPGRQPDRHQAARHQRRRLLQYQLGAPVRKPEHLDEYHRGVGDPRARLGARRHLRPHDRARARGLGAARRHDAVHGRRLRHRLLGGSRRQSVDARHGRRRRQHGGQGGPLRRPAIGDLGDLHDRRFQRLGQLHARLATCRSAASSRWS